MRASPAEDPIAACLREYGVVTGVHRRPRPFPASGHPGEAIPIASIIRAPPGIGAVALGVVCAINKNGPDGFPPEDGPFLRAAAGAISAALYNRRLAAAIADQARTRRDPELAAVIQRNLLPAADPAASPVNGLNRPARLVSGDFYDYLTLPERRARPHRRALSRRGPADTSDGAPLIRLNVASAPLGPRPPAPRSGSPGAAR